MNDLVRAALEEYHMLEPGQRVLVGLSGGADSTALLLCLRELEIPVTALYVEHGIRGEESLRDEEFCRALCEKLEVPFESRRVDVPALARAEGMSVELAARQARYALLQRVAEQHGCHKIATAHTADDNAETLLFRLARGTGPEGLAGIPPVRGNLIRPLLGCTRRQVEAYLASRKQTYMTDSTNHSDDYARNRLRHHVMPWLEREYPGATERMAAVAGDLLLDQQLLGGMTEEFIQSHVRREGESLLLERQSLEQLAPALRGRVLVRLVRLAGQEPHRVHVQQMLSMVMMDGEFRELTLPGGLRWQCSCGQLRLGPAQEVPSYGQQLEVGTQVELPGGYRVTSQMLNKIPPKIQRKLMTAYLDYDTIKQYIFVRNRRSGDRYPPQGMAGSRSIKKWMIEARIPRMERDRLPLFLDGQQLVWCPGLPPREGYAADEHTRRVLEITVEKEKE
ncbi:MAG: tRNA lysidine(34) synthetase TilS [Eubacteriales bacterium]|jgi:tRNA(Ile)-lysidine synthase